LLHELCKRGRHCNTRERVSLAVMSGVSVSDCTDVQMSVQSTTLKATLVDVPNVSIGFRAALTVVTSAVLFTRICHNIRPVTVT
jgi:hypothetical protein